MKSNIKFESNKIKPKKKHTWKLRSARAGVGILAFVSGLAAAFFLVPSPINIIDLGMPEEVEAPEETYFSRFASKVAPLVSGEAPLDEAFGLEASLDGLQISWPNNDIEVKGELKANIRAIDDLDLSLDLDVDYNSKAIDLGVAFVDKSLYLCTKDLRVKQSFITNEDATDELSQLMIHIMDLFFNPSNEEGMKINLDIDGLLGGLVDSIDLSSLTSGSGLEVEETYDESYAYSNLKIAIDEETSINISLKIEKETVSLVGVDLGTMKFGDVTIKGNLKCHSHPSVKVLAFDNPEYTYKKHGDFISLINYSSFVDDIFRLLNTRTVGLDIKASLKDEKYSYGYLNAGIDLDASRFAPINFIGKSIDASLLKSDESVEKAIIKRAGGTEENTITDILNDFDFNLGLELGNYVTTDGITELVDYSNLDIAYFKDSEGANAGYLTFNEENDNAVMRAKIDVDTINYLISEIANLIDKTDKKAIKKDGEKSDEGLFDFVTGSDFVLAIQEQRYDGILDLLENIENTEKTIQITVNLSSLGFGEDAKVVLKLDAEKNTESPTNVISIDAKNVELGKLVLNAEINTRPFEKTSLEKIDAIKDKFDPLDFVPGTFDQVEKIVDDKTLGFKLEGSAYDEQSLGFAFDGWGQMDLNENKGFGHIQFDETKYPGKLQTPHTVDISIDNKDGDHTKNNMLFEYRETLKGRFTLQTFDDLIDIVMKLIKTPDKRFTKFLGPIYEKIIGSVILTSLESKNYLALSQSSLITSIKQVNDGMSIDIVLSKHLLMDLLPSDLTLRINFKKDAQEEKTIDSIEVVDLDALGKKINAKISLVNFEAERQNPVDLSGKFLDFSDIAVLLAFGIDTVQLDYYHVKLVATISLGNLLPLPIKTMEIDAHLLLKDDKLKVYFDVPKGPNPLYNMSVEFAFEPNDNPEDLLGGRFYMLRKDRPTGLSLLAYRRQNVWFVEDEDVFADNIIELLLKGLIGLGDDLTGSIVKRINESEGNVDEVDPKYENIFTSTGFVYTENESKNEYTWNTGISIEAITGKSVVGPVEATITGKKVGDKCYLQSAKASLSIASLIGIKADISLLELDPNVKDWPAEIEAKYYALTHFSTVTNQILNNLNGYAFSI